MDFSINFMSRVTAVLKEAFLLKKYKAMHLGFAIPVGILMLPMLLISLVCALFLYVMGYFFSVSALPVQSLHKLLKEEGQSIHHGAQIVVYLLSWGFVFSSYVALSFLMVWLTVLYTVFSISTFTWSLGGIKFHLFSNEENISVEVNGKYHFLIPVIFLAIMVILLFVYPLISATSYAIRFDSHYFAPIFRARMLSTLPARLSFSVVYSALAFAVYPKKAEEKIEEKTEE